MPDMNRIVGSHDILMLTLDTLRFDAALERWQAGLTPNFARAIGAAGWQKRHAPASFTYASHQAFFAGFLPTPSAPGIHPRLFALRFLGSESTGPDTCVLDGPDIVRGLAARDYHTVCIGGVGFFNKQNALGSVLPNLFAESHWQPEFGVTNPRSFDAQIDCVEQLLQRLPAQQRLFLFVNVSALHQPNCCYVPGAHEDTLESHGAALSYVDSALPRLLRALQRRAPTFGIVCSDHGTMYGEEGYRGHRIGHELVWTVPYAELLLEAL